MRYVLILDTETTGVDAKADAAIEVGCILYDIANAAPVASFASLIRAESNAAENINRIPVAALLDSPPPGVVWPRVEALATLADAILAHRAEFDRGFVPVASVLAKPWICTMADLEWPNATRLNPGLVALALEHGLGVAHAHRALADCDLIARLLTRIAEQGTNLEAFLARGLRPKATYQALVSFADKDKAKDAGFLWEPDRKRWIRTLAIEDVSSLPFPTRLAS